MPQTVIQWIIAVFGVGGIGRFLWDSIAAISRRKNKTDNTVTLVNSATGYAASLNERIDSINDRFDEFRKEQERKEDERDRRDRQQVRLLLEHSKWDHRVVVALRTLGSPVEEAPPLFVSEGNDT